MHVRANSHLIPLSPFTKIRLKITYIRFHSDLPGVKELKVSIFYISNCRIYAIIYHNYAMARSNCTQSTHWPQRNNSFYELISWVSSTKLVLGKCHRIQLMKSQHRLRYWLGAIRQQAITLANVDQDLCHHMVPQDHNELKTVSKHIL